MDCENIEKLRTAYGDGELALGDALAVETHLKDCAACRAALANQAALSAAIKHHAEVFEAPMHLEHRIRAALPQSTNLKPNKQARARAWRLFAPALGAAVALVLTVGFFVRQPTADDLLADEAVSSHVRSLLTDRITDVLSSDQHTVKPWITAKLDFSPPVHDLASEGFPLLGCRLDYFGHRSVAALVYKHRQHVINLFVAPAKGGPAPSAPDASSRQGYQLVDWRQGGMAYWAVSDLNQAELAQFVALLRKSIA